MHVKQYPIIISLCYAIARAHLHPLSFPLKCSGSEHLNHAYYISWIYLLLKQRSQIASTTAQTVAVQRPWGHGSDEYTPCFCLSRSHLTFLMSIWLSVPITVDQNRAMCDDHHPVQHETFSDDGTPDGFSFSPAPATRSQLHSLCYLNFGRIVWIFKTTRFPFRRAPKTQDERIESTIKPHIPFHMHGMVIACIWVIHIDCGTRKTQTKWNWNVKLLFEEIMLFW